MGRRIHFAASAPTRTRRIPVGYPVLAGVGVLFAVLAASIVVAVIAIVSLSRDQAELQDRNVPYAVAITTAALNAKAMANHERGFLISGDSEFLEEFDQGLLDVRTTFAAAVRSADGERQLDAVAKAHRGFEQWVRAVQSQFRTYQAGKRQAATTAALGRGRALRKTYEASLEEAEAVASTAIRHHNNPFASTAFVANLLISLFVLFAICVATTVWLLRTLKLASDADDSTEPLPEPVALSEASVRELRRHGG